MTKSLLLVIALTHLCFGQISFDQIRNAEPEPGNWLTYSGNYQSHRYSPLTQINRSNVASLKVAWVYQMRQPGRVETSPIVVDGVLYITENGSIATALDGKTGRPLWQYRRSIPSGMSLCCGIVNRGLAVLGNTLFFSTIDAHLVALDMRSGAVRWDVTVADYHKGYSSTAAPLVVKNKVIVGVAGGDYGIRGFLDAYDPSTGQKVWRLWAVPGAGDPGNETWDGESWHTGGAATWMTGSYDPILNLIYWCTGNPWPDLNGEDRKGDNLYSNSVLAIDADTGKLKWYFQFNPHDNHNWDGTQIPVLVDSSVGGRTRKLLVQANADGFYYVLDRETGEFIQGIPYLKITWAKNLDERGRPVRLPNSDPTPEGNLIYPGGEGGTLWFSPSYSPSTRLFYVTTQEAYGGIFYRTKTEARPGEVVESGSDHNLPGDEWPGVIRALEAETGKLRWKFTLHSPAAAGLLSTAGQLLFGSSFEGNFFALDAESGEVLWHFQTGGMISANPVTFLMQGKQYVAITAGQSLFLFTN